MANVKITSLPAYTTPQVADVLPIVDVSGPTTKKITLANLLASAPAKCVLSLLGANSPYTDPGTFYTCPGDSRFVDSASGNESGASYVVPYAGTLSNFTVRTGSVAASSMSVTFTVRKNDVDTTVTVMAPTTINTSASDSTHTAIFAAGDVLTIKAVITGVGVNTASLANITMQYG